MATQGMTEKDLEGNDFLSAGMYHVSIAGVREMVDDNYVQLDFIVLNGKPADPALDNQRGKKISERLYISGKDDDATEKCMKRLARVAVSLGLIDKSQIGQDLDVDFSLAEGRDCVIRVKREKYTIKNGERAGQQGERSQVDFFGFWATDHEDVTQVPKDPAWSPPAGSAASSPAPVGAGASNRSQDFDDV